LTHPKSHRVSDSPQKTSWFAFPNSSVLLARKKRLREFRKCCDYVKPLCRLCDSKLGLLKAHSHRRLRKLRSGDRRLAAMTVTDFSDVPIWAVENNDPMKTQFAYKRVGLPLSQRFVAPNGRSTARAIPLTSGSIAGRASVQLTMVWWLGLCGVSLLNVAV